MNFNDFLALARTALGATVAETTLEEVVEERRTSAAASVLDDALRARGRGAVFGSSRDDLTMDPEFRKRVLAAMEQLSERERQVVTLLYFDDMDLEQIARVLGVTRSRVSQLRGEAILRLRAKLTEPDVT